MINFVKEEIKKFLKSKVKYSLLILLIPTVISFFMYGFNEKYDGIEWTEYFNLIMTFLNYIVCSIVYGIVTAYTIGREYESRTINILFTYPINRIKILFSKWLFILSVIFSSLLSVFVISLVGGLFLKHDPITSSIILYYLFGFIKMVVYHFMLIFFVSAVTIIAKSVLAPIIVIVAMSFANLVIVNTNLGNFYPWSAPALLSPHEGIGRAYINYGMAAVSLIVIFAVGLAISIKRYKYIE